MFKLSCMSAESKFKTMVIQTNLFVIFLGEYTKSTYIMVVLNNKSVNMGLIKLNIRELFLYFNNIFFFFSFHSINHAFIAALIARRVSLRSLESDASGP